MGRKKLNLNDDERKQRKEKANQVAKKYYHENKDKILDSLQNKKIASQTLSQDLMTAQDEIQRLKDQIKQMQNTIDQLKGLNPSADLPIKPKIKLKIELKPKV